MLPGSVDGCGLHRNIKPHGMAAPDVAFWRGTPYCHAMSLGGHKGIGRSRAFLDELSKQHPGLVNVTVKDSDGVNYEEVTNQSPGSRHFVVAVKVKSCRNSTAAGQCHTDRRRWRHL